MEPLRVLVVDDEIGMRAGVARALRDFTVTVPELAESVSFEVSQAEAGEQALPMIAEESPDILLLDHKLPGISGLEVLEGIGNGVEAPLTIMITAYASIETAVTATKRGAYDFLAKPFAPNELRSVIRKASSHLLLKREAQKLAEEKRRVRFEFVRVLGHELKAPIAAVMGYLDMMERRSLGGSLEKYERCLARSRIRLAGMNKLIIDLLDLTRIESGQASRELAVLHLCDVVEAAVELAAVSAELRGIKISLVCPEGIQLYADRGEIDMVLNNLLSNAVKYNRDGGAVDVAVTSDSETVTIAVTDTGIGMSEEELTNLFGEFVRVKNRKTREILGSGLGLSIVKKIAQLYDGDVAVESTPDVGSTFSIHLRNRSSVPSA